LSPVNDSTWIMSTTVVASTTILTVTVEGVGQVPVTVTEHGAGRPFPMLHGGAGATVGGQLRRPAGEGRIGPGPGFRPTRGSARRRARRAWIASVPWPASTRGCSMTSG
jgi:hypothetical protein